MSRREGVVAVCRCNKVHNLYGIRIEKINGKWMADWTFKLKEKTAKQEGYGTQTIDDFDIAENYPGCPYCGVRTNFVICECGKMTSCANSASGSVFRCEWCGTEGVLGRYDGSGIRTGGDI